MVAGNLISKANKRPFYKKRGFFLWLIGGVIGILLMAYMGVGTYIASEFTKGKVHDLGPDTPTTYGMAYDNITFKTADKAQLTIRGWWIPRQDSKRVLIMVHAKDGTRTFLLPLSYRLWQEGFNILLFDTRGQGQSEGDRYSFGYHEKFDVVGAVNFVKAKGFQPQSIGVVGWSMGAAISLQAMAETPDIKAGVMESSFGNLERVILHSFNPATGLPEFFYPGVKLAALLFDDIDISRTNPQEDFPRLGDRKIFLIHTQNDEVIPVAEFQHLLQAGGISVADNWLVGDSKHVRSFQDHPDEYIKRVVAFFNRELK
jgi:dipeptidyl aminopeptidase/acylaminoacyl peptidase